MNNEETTHADELHNLTFTPDNGIALYGNAMSRYPLRFYLSKRKREKELERERES